MQDQAGKDGELDFDGPATSPSDGGDFLTTEQVREAILRYLDEGSIDAAASLIASSGAEVGDELLSPGAEKRPAATRAALAEAFFRARDFERAGRAALMLDDPEQAARFLEQSGQIARAAQLHEKAGRLERAAELYERARELDRAALLYEQLHKPDRAAAAYERGGRPFEAGRLWTKLRRLDRALEALQKVDQASPHFVAAMQLLGRILEYTGHKEAAAARYLDVVNSRPLDASTVELHERLIELYVASGNTGDARRLIRNVMTFAPNRPRAARALGQLLGKGSADATLKSAGSPRNDSTPPRSAGAGAGAGPASQASSGPVITVTAVHPTVDALRKLPLLSELSLDELRALHALGERCSYQTGQTIIEQDDEGGWFLVLLSGSVEVLRAVDGREIRLDELRYGACLGEMSLIDEGPSSARVRALTEVSAFRWPVAALREHLKSEERTALRMLRVMTRTLSVRLREANSRVTT